MKHRATVPVPRRLLAAALVLLAATPAAAADELATRFVLLAGRPGTDSGATERGALVVPGLVIALGDATPEPSRILAGAEEVAEVAGKLERTLGLDSIEVLYSTLQRLDLNEPVTLLPHSATTPVRVHVALQGFNRELATYRVRFTDGGSAFADSVVSVPHGKRALVGGLDGDEAPFLFLVVEPQRAAPAVESGVTPPRIVERTAPQYTPEAREARIQGVVILQLEIDRHATVRKTTVLKGLPMGLSEAAVEAVRQWRFEPALDAAGRPVDVHYNVTVHFRLDDAAAPRVP